MALKFPNGGEEYALGVIVNKTPQANLTLHLFANDVTPGETDTAATYTEASGSGYASKTLTGASWTITPGAPTSAVYASQTFTFSAAHGAIYGYYYKSGSTLLAPERFTNGPFTPSASGYAITFVPTITLKDETD